MSIHGHCPPALAPLQTAFSELFDADEELGAAVAVTLDGDLIAHLWAGYADKRKTQNFAQDTLVPVYSTGKALVSLVVAQVVDQFDITYDTPVGQIWPELNPHGVGAITLAQLMSHQSGLCGFTSPMEASDWFEWETITKRLEATTPLWTPGTAHGYEPITFGFLAGEIVRRISSQTIPQWVATHWREALGLDLWFGGLGGETHRIAELARPTRLPDLSNLTPERQAAFLERWSAPAGRGSATWREANLPAANLHATAPALAEMMSILTTGGERHGERVISPSTLGALCQEHTQGPDKVLPFALSWAAGLLRNGDLGIYGPNPDAVGHSGWGGSCAFADPERGLGFAYVMNKQSHHLLGDPRPLALIRALYDSLD